MPRVDEPQLGAKSSQLPTWVLLENNQNHLTIYNLQREHWLVFNSGRSTKLRRVTARPFIGKQLLPPFLGCYSQAHSCYSESHKVNVPKKDSMLIMNKDLDSISRIPLENAAVPQCSQQMWDSSEQGKGLNHPDISQYLERRENKRKVDKTNQKANRSQQLNDVYDHSAP